MARLSKHGLHRKIFAARLCEIMEKHRLSQTALAEATGITQTKISRYMRGANEPKLADLAAICVYFNVSPEAFLDSSVPIRSLTDGKKARETATMSPVQHKLYRDLFQTLESKLLTLNEDAQDDYLRAWVAFVQKIAK